MSRVTHLLDMNDLMEACYEDGVRGGVVNKWGKESVELYKEQVRYRDASGKNWGKSTLRGKEIVDILDKGAKKNGYRPNDPSRPGPSDPYRKDSRTGLSKLESRQAELYPPVAKLCGATKSEVQAMGYAPRYDSDWRKMNENNREAAFLRAREEQAYHPGDCSHGGSSSRGSSSTRTGSGASQGTQSSNGSSRTSSTNGSSRGSQGYQSSSGSTHRSSSSSQLSSRGSQGYQSSNGSSRTSSTNRSSGGSQGYQSSSGSAHRSSSSSQLSSRGSLGYQSSSGSTHRSSSSRRSQASNGSVATVFGLSGNFASPDDRSPSSRRRLLEGLQGTQGSSGSTPRSSSSQRSSRGSRGTQSSTSSTQSRSSSSSRGSATARQRSADAATRRRDEACILCCQNHANAVFAPCGHNNVCMGCAERLNPKICPCCRDPFVMAIKKVG